MGEFGAALLAAPIFVGHASPQSPPAQYPGVEQPDGLTARDDISASVIVESGLCVTAADGAIGFHRMACGSEFVDPHPIRRAAREATAAEITPVTPSPRPTPTEPSTPPTRSPVNVDEQPYLGEPSVFFVLCTPWLFPLNVKIDNVDAPKLHSSPPSTSVRCVLPKLESGWDQGSGRLRILWIFRHPPASGSGRDILERRVTLRM